MEKPIPKRIYVRQFRFSLNGSIQLKTEYASTKEMIEKISTNNSPLPSYIWFTFLMLLFVAWDRAVSFHSSLGWDQANSVGGVGWGGVVHMWVGGSNHVRIREFEGKESLRGVVASRTNNRLLIGNFKLYHRIAITLWGKCFFTRILGIHV